MAVMHVTLRRGTWRCPRPLQRLDHDTNRDPAATLHEVLAGLWPVLAARSRAAKLVIGIPAARNPGGAEQAIRVVHRPAADQRQRGLL
jgi:hypothetical protein